MCSSNEEKLLAEQQENLHVVIQRSSLHNRLLPSAVIFLPGYTNKMKKQCPISAKALLAYLSHDI